MNNESMYAADTVRFIRRMMNILNMVSLLSIMVILMLVVKLVYGFLGYIPVNSVIVFLAMTALLSASVYLNCKHTSCKAISIIQEYSSKLNTLLNRSREVHEIEHADVLYEKVVEIAIEMTGADGGALLELEDDELVFKTVMGPNRGELSGNRVRKNEGLAARALLEGSPVVADDVTIGDSSLSQMEGRLGHSVKSVLCVPMSINGEVVGIMEMVKDKPNHFSDKDVEVMNYFIGQSMLSVKRSKFYEDQKNFEVHLTNMLVDAVENKSERTGHQNRVAKYSLIMGRAIGLPDDELKVLYRASMLHDIGLLKIHQDDIKSACDYNEHSILGYGLLSQVTFYKDIAEIVLHHHESYDGRGYPDGLTDDNIPLMSRIIAIAEAFDTMTSRQSYKVTGTLINEDVMPDIVDSYRALLELKANSGTQFDPHLVDVFVNSIDACEYDINARQVVHVAGSN